MDEVVGHLSEWFPQLEKLSVCNTLLRENELSAGSLKQFDRLRELGISKDWLSRLQQDRGFSGKMDLRSTSESAGAENRLQRHLG